MRADAGKRMRPGAWMAASRNVESEGRTVVTNQIRGSRTCSKHLRRRRVPRIDLRQKRRPVVLVQHEVVPEQIPEVRTSTTKRSRFAGSSALIPRSASPVRTDPHQAKRRCIQPCVSRESVRVTPTNRTLPRPVWRDEHRRIRISLQPAAESTCGSSSTSTFPVPRHLMLRPTRRRAYRFQHPRRRPAPVGHFPHFAPQAQAAPNSAKTLATVQPDLAPRSTTSARFPANGPR